MKITDKENNYGIQKGYTHDTLTTPDDIEVPTEKVIGNYINCVGDTKVKKEKEKKRNKY